MNITDLDFLLSPNGKDLLALAAELDFSPAHAITSTSAVREANSDYAAAAIEVVAARRRAQGRIRGAEEMLLTGDAVQQATAWPVAALRATRLSGRDVHDLTCSVGAELRELVRGSTASAAGGHPRILGSDLDPMRARMAAHNVPEAQIIRADALRPVSRDCVLLADPGRRSGGRRLRDPAQLLPPLPDLLEACRDRDFAVKCAPGLDLDRIDFSGEAELVSLDGGVREACLWSTALSGGIRRRATVLRTKPGAHEDDGLAGLDIETITDTEPDEVLVDAQADRYLVDPDGAIVRAGLVRHWASRHGLRQLDSRIAHLTGPQIPQGYSGFEILQRCRLDKKELRRVFRDLNCGALEILVRGVDIDPDKLRASLALKGVMPLALVITRIERSAVAFVCAPREQG